MQNIPKMQLHEQRIDRESGLDECENQADKGSGSVEVKDDTKDEGMYVDETEKIDPPTRLPEVEDDGKVGMQLEPSEVKDEAEHQVSAQMQVSEVNYDADVQMQWPNVVEDAESPIAPPTGFGQFNDVQQQDELPPQSLLPSMPTPDEMFAVLSNMEAAFLACLPQGELNNLDLYSGPSEQVGASPELRETIPAEDVEKNMGNFMSSANKLRKYFIGLQRPDPPSRADVLRKEIAMMEQELKTKDLLIEKHQKNLEGWRRDVEEQLSKHVDELKRV